MKSTTQSFEPLVLPSDEIGWSDESFDLALRYVMHSTNLAEASDKQRWLYDHVAQGPMWAVGRNLANESLFKRPMLLTFRGFEPSAMQNAFNEIKQHPRPYLKQRNIIYTIINVVLGTGIVVIAFAMIIFLLSSAF